MESCQPGSIKPVPNFLNCSLMQHISNLLTPLHLLMVWAVTMKTKTLQPSLQTITVTVIYKGAFATQDSISAETYPAF